MLAAMNDGDRVIRAMSRDGSFRVVAVRSTRTVASIVRAQGATGENAKILGQLASLSVLYRETMAPTMRVQVVLRGANDSGQMVADSHPDGWARGLLRAKDDRTLDLRGQDALIQLQRPLRNGEMHVGTVAIPEDARLGSAATAYFAQSEQTTTMVALGTVLADDDDTRVVAAGGFLVQVLPEGRDLEGKLATMMLRLEEFVDIDDRLRTHDGDPQYFVDEVLYGFEIEPLASSPLRFGCACSEERFLSSLATLDAAAIDELVSSSELIESTCDYCGAAYAVDPEVLRGLARRS